MICALHVAVRVDTLIELGQEKSVVDAEALEKKILEALRAAKGPKTRPEIEDSVEGKTGRKRRALQRLVNAGNVVQEGSGTKGDPYKYKMLDPCSRIYVGTREQESQKGLEPRINTGEMLVPENSEERATILMTLARRISQWREKVRDTIRRGLGVATTKRT